MDGNRPVQGMEEGGQANQRWKAQVQEVCLRDRHSEGSSTKDRSKRLSFKVQQRKEEFGSTAEDD